MIENSKVIIRIEYVCDGIRRVFYGEIDKNKLDELNSEEENFICLTNDGQVAWIDKEAILSLYELETKVCAYERGGMEDAPFAVKQGIKIKS